MMFLSCLSGIHMASNILWQGSSTMKTHHPPKRHSTHLRSRGDDDAIRLKRIYALPLRGDGFRVLVDRLWPRGVSRARAALDDWQRELAPSPPLRKWFGHDPRRWTEFRRRYRAELRNHAEELAELKRRAAGKRLTLLYAATDPRINHAAVLKQVLAEPVRPAAASRGARRRIPARTTPTPQGQSR